MENPESSMRGNPPPHWDFPEYHTPREYMGKEVKPGLQNATKRGFYMDYMLKVAKGVPSSQHYKTADSWSTEKKDTKKLDLKSRRMSYIDHIQIDQKKKRSVPGVGAYSLLSTDKEVTAKKTKLAQISDKKVDGAKRFYYEDTEFLSNVNPGPGNYNPREIEGKQVLNKTDPKFWKSKHQKELKDTIDKLKLKPSPASYSTDKYGTFEHLSKTLPMQKTQAKVWGTSSRFNHYQLQKGKSKVPEEKRPSPATYDMSLIWRGKSAPGGKDKNKDKKKDWLSLTSKPTVGTGVYH